MEKWTRFFVLTLAIFLNGCSSFLYYPSRGIFFDFKKLNPPPEEHKVLSGKIDVHGWFFKTKNPKGTFVFFHGNAQNRSAHFLTLYWVVKEGYNLAIFDYPGYGQTKGSPSPQSTVAAAKDVLKYVYNLDPQQSLIVYGQSLGGAIATRATWEVRNSVHPKLLVIDSSFLSYKQAARKVMAKSAWTWLLQPLSYVLFSDTWAPKEVVSKFTQMPTLVVHSKSDEIIPFELGEDVFAHASSPKDFWVKNDNGHNNVFSSREDQLEFLRRIQTLIQP